MTEIVCKTNDYVVIYKPAGIPSQSDLTGDKDAMTITAELLCEMGESKSLFLIHRLDRVVGGLMIFARNKSYAATLSSLVSEHKFTKEYFAVVDGSPESGRFVDYIYKDSSLSKAFVTDRKRSGVKEAVLDFVHLESVTLENGRVLSLVKVKPLTGRFHQIRVQFASRKMPLVGDKKYGSKDAVAKFPSLFATRLAFDLGKKSIDSSLLPDLSDYPWSLFDENSYKEQK